MSKYRLMSGTIIETEDIGEGEALCHGCGIVPEGGHNCPHVRMPHIVKDVEAAERRRYALLSAAAVVFTIPSMRTVEIQEQPIACVDVAEKLLAEIERREA